MGIRPKLILLVIALTLPILGAGGLVSVRFTEDQLMDEMKHRGLSLLSALSVPCSIALANHEIERLDDYLAQFRPPASNLGAKPEMENSSVRDPIRDLRSLCVLDSEGRVIAHTEETAYGELRRDPFALRALSSDRVLYRTILRPEGNRLEIALPVKSGLRWGTLLAEFSLDRLEQRTAKLRWYVIKLTGVLMVLMTLAMILGLSSQVIKPLRRLHVMAEHLRKRDLDHRIEVTRRDELGTLGEVFNNTAAELASYTHDLEHKVRERSAEIVEKNEELKRTNLRLSEVNLKLEELATTDGLTGLANKTHLLTRMEFEILRAKRGDHPLSLIMLDVDKFKHFNDTHGHVAGDKLLARLAEVMKSNLRSIDIIGRFGGEEFCIALLDSNKKAAVRAAEKLRKAVEKEKFEGGKEQPGGKLTISLGVAELAVEAEELTQLIERADAALYEAKRAGRNRVEVAE
ncbi:MAG: diguanylate cyclase [Deltaproteobacteria bacterium]|nr:diguanylate cyclase [Deltaproteobacteria bacterium]